MKEICKNCKYWGEKKDLPETIKVLKTCKRVQMFWESTEWAESLAAVEDPVTEEDSDYDEADWVRVLSPANKDDKAFVKDGSDYFAELITMEDFGCNQFKKVV